VEYTCPKLGEQVRIQIASDLHHEFSLKNAIAAPRIVIAPDVDVLVLAGDIHCHTHAVDMYGHCLENVIYVHGNHEPYGAELYGIVSEIRRKSEKSSVRFLEREKAIIGNVRFLGACGWTDYRLRPETMGIAMREAARVMPDHRSIRLAGSSMFQPFDAANLHRETTTWLARELDEPFNGKTVVVTHHAPSARSIPATHVNSVLAPAFASNLEHLMVKADLWIHGHIHASSDYDVGKCRVVCNPRGYPGKNARFPEVPFQNASFNPSLVIEV
jgi:predicted phosphodiesterase